MKIFAAYKPTDKPWGGANNFLRSLYQTLEKNHNVKIVYEPTRDCDLFFFGQTAKGPANEGSRYTLEDFKKIIALNPKAPAIMRMVNLRRHTSHEYAFTYWLNFADRNIDSDTKKSAACCDFLIFQSSYQKDNFARDGVMCTNDAVIHNGAAAIFSNYNGSVPKLKNGEKMRIFASAVSTKGWKNHGVIAAASQNDNVELFYAGVWPDQTKNCNIKMLGRLDHQAILDAASTCHYFLHPSLKEACSNSIIEALAMGLPVLHGRTGSSPETVGNNGMPVDKTGLDKQLHIAAERQPSFVDHLEKERDRYSMQHTAAKYYAAFEEAVKRKARM